MDESQTNSVDLPWPACPVTLNDQGVIEVAHGGGGRKTHQLIASIFIEAFGDPLQTRGHDGAVFTPGSERLAITTDSYVVDPIEFPGGDIGSLSVHGTANDLLMCGARPQYLSVAFVLETGLPISTLRRITASMRQAADEAGVAIVTGDTKVIQRDRGDGMTLTTTGIGQVFARTPIGPAQVTDGSAIIVSGDLGRHGIAVMSAREQLDLGDAIHSDSACLAPAVLPLLDSGLPIQCLRDLTRGGLATALVEIAQSGRIDIEIDEQAVPINETVRGACELLGLDPLYVANEGRFIVILPDNQAKQAVALLQATDIARDARVIGRVARGDGGVSARTAIGTRRVIDMISGEQLPRIC